MRHAPFRVDAAAHDAWLAAMSNSLDHAAAAHAMSNTDRAELWDYLTRAAFAMVNTFPTDPRAAALPTTDPPGSGRRIGAEPNG
jgi:truncated hemoglobin YjbI